MFNMPKLYLENIEPENWDRLTAELKLLVFEYYYEGRPSVGSVAHKHSIWKIVMPFVDKDIPGSQDLIQRAYYSQTTFTLSRHWELPWIYYPSPRFAPWIRHLQLDPKVYIFDSKSAIFTVHGAGRYLNHLIRPRLPKLEANKSLNPTRMLWKKHFKNLNTLELNFHIVNPPKTTRTYVTGGWTTSKYQCFADDVYAFVETLEDSETELRAKHVQITVEMEGCNNHGRVLNPFESVPKKQWGEPPPCGCADKVREAFEGVFRAGP